MTRSALVNDATNIVENICVADPVTPSPYAGMFMVGLQDAVYEQQTTTQTTTHAAGSTVSVNTDGTVTITLPDGTKENYPAGTTVVTNADGTVTTTVYTSEQVLVTPATPCDMGWIYNPATGTFSAP